MQAVSHGRADGGSAQRVEKTAVLPQPIGVRYDLAQTALGLPGGQFVVGRWDGSLQLWRLTDRGPQLLSVATLLSGEGVQALAPIGEQKIVSSHDGESLALWSVLGDRLERQNLVEYPKSLGIATSAAVIEVGSIRGLVVGHESGWLSFWRPSRFGLNLITTLDVRAAQPVPSPYPLKHIRGLVQTAAGQLVSGSEDGDLVLIKLGPSLDALQPEVSAKVRYSPTAKRGINGLALWGEWLAVTNCSVGERDTNLHLWRVLPGQLLPMQSLLLRSEPQRDQVFSFAAQWSKTGTLWVTTQEGLLWQLRLVLPVAPKIPPKLGVEGKLSVASNVGTALVYDQERKLLVAVGHEATVLKVP